MNKTGERYNSSKTYVVAPRSSVCDANRRIYKEGAEVPGLTTHQMKEHVEKSGFMVEKGSPQSYKNSDTLPPGTSAMVPIGDDYDQEGGSRKSPDPIEVLTEPESEPKKGRVIRLDDGGKVVEVKPKEAGKPSSLWTLDPDGLRGLSLETLQVAISERDASLPKFEDAAEALAWLSKDYQGE